MRLISGLVSGPVQSPTSVPEPTGVDEAPWIGQEAVDEIEESNRINAPDVYLRNKLPVSQPTFSMDSYIDHERESYVFTVIPKIDSLQEVQQDLLDWLLSIDLNEEQTCYSYH
jgi:uncharacterized membrane protein YagU involved in acid resistance